VLLRANELAAVPGPFSTDALFRAPWQSAMVKHHLDSIVHRTKRMRGQIDSNLEVARAKIDDAATFEEAIGYLTTRETLAVLNDRPMLERVMKMAPGDAADFA
jgi:membrane glycosyltransferase